MELPSPTCKTVTDIADEIGMADAGDVVNFVMSGAEQIHSIIQKLKPEQDMGMEML